VSETEQQPSASVPPASVPPQAQAQAQAQAPAPGAEGPRPEPIRFFGTTWVDHDGGYGWRRAGLALGSLLATAAGAFVLRFGFQGLSDANIGFFVTLLAIVGFAVCSALAFQRTWRGFSERRTSEDPDAARSAQGLMAIGFLGSLLAYFFRCFSEAPGEGLHRAEYQAALERHARRRAGKPAPKAKRKRR
jgi:hypothetical protein